MMGIEGKAAGIRMADGFAVWPARRRELISSTASAEPDLKPD
jgi:hypothetical protein